MKPTINTINLDIFKRNIQLHILGIDSLGYREREIYEYLDYSLTDLKTYVSHIYPSSKFMGKTKGNISIEYTDANKLYIDRDKLLGGLKSLMDETDLIHLTIWLLKLRYNLDMTHFSTFYPLEVRVSELEEI